MCVCAVLFLFTHSCTNTHTHSHTHTKKLQRQILIVVLPMQRIAMFSDGRQLCMPQPACRQSANLSSPPSHVTSSTHVTLTPSPNSPPSHTHYTYTHRKSVHSLRGWFGVYDKPSSLHTTMASSWPHPSSQTPPHSSPNSISTLPSLTEAPPTRRTLNAAGSSVLCECMCGTSLSLLGHS